MSIKNPLDRAIFRSTVNKSPKIWACTQMGHLGQVRQHRISCPLTMFHHFMSILRGKVEKKGINLCLGRIGFQILGPNCLIFRPNSAQTKDNTLFFNLFP